MKKNEKRLDAKRLMLELDNIGRLSDRIYEQRRQWGNFVTIVHMFFAIYFFVWIRNFKIYLILAFVIMLSFLINLYYVSDKVASWKDVDKALERYEALK